MLTQKLVPGRHPDVYIPGQTIHAYILRDWYLVHLIKPAWAAALSLAYTREYDCGLCLHAKFHVDQFIVLPLRGEKPKFENAFNFSLWWR